MKIFLVNTMKKVDGIQRTNVFETKEENYIFNDFWTLQISFSNLETSKKFH